MIKYQGKWMQGHDLSQATGNSTLYACALQSQHRYEFSGRETSHLVSLLPCSSDGAYVPLSTSELRLNATGCFSNSIVITQNCKLSFCWVMLPASRFQNFLLALLSVIFSPAALEKPPPRCSPACLLPRHALQTNPYSCRTSQSWQENMTQNLPNLL